MKKLNLLLLSVLAAATYSYGQYFQLSVGGGYAWPGLTNTTTVKGFQPLLSNSIADVNNVLDPANASVIDFVNSTSYGHFTGTDNTYSDTAGSKSTVHGSYASGANITIAASYRINPYISVGLNFNYLWGNTISSSQLYGNSVTATLGPNTMVTQKTHATGLSVMPSVTAFAAPARWKVKPYVRFSINLPLAGSVEHDIHVESPSALLNTTHLTSDLKVKTESQFSLGFNGGLGVMYQPIPLISIWGEVTGTYLNVAAKTSTLTEYVIDGRNLTTGATTHADRIAGTGQLPGIITALGGTNAPLTQYSRVIEYVNELNSESNTTDYGKQRDKTGAHNGQAGYVDESKNHQLQRPYAPFSNFGLSVGISINMSKKIFQDPLGKKAKAEAEKK
ncbi:MAG: outer membrane beta-barrel protein [Bacteroidetes bacterium]|nr:outer membrane beta-barrel protein [Bacteroidota bacterium]MBS1683794.1 outer membrane beta-barrel protein [Bacteroidota bacterium]